MTLLDATNRWILASVCKGRVLIPLDQLYTPKTKSSGCRDSRNSYETRAWARHQWRWRQMAPKTVFRRISLRPWHLQAQDFVGVLRPRLSQWGSAFISSSVVDGRHTSQIPSENAPKMGFGQCSKTFSEWRDGFLLLSAQDPPIFSTLRSIPDQKWQKTRLRILSECSCGRPRHPNGRLGMSRPSTGRLSLGVGSTRCACIGRVDSYQPGRVIRSGSVKIADLASAGHFGGSPLKQDHGQLSKTATTDQEECRLRRGWRVRTQAEPRTRQPGCGSSSGVDQVDA